MIFPLVTLVILDGWGVAPPGPGNAVAQARTPVFDDLCRRFPDTVLAASGPAVGLPEGQMGNSEVGHLTIGSGRILYQDLVRVNKALEDGSLFTNQALLAAFEQARAADGDVHLLGLVSRGGVHSHLEHFLGLYELARRLGYADRTWIHAFTDGRDVSPTSAVADLRALPERSLATVCGRYYAMDRDSRWERTDIALAALLKNSNQNDVSSSGRDGRARCKDAGSVHSSAMDATEDEAACRPARPEGSRLHCDSSSKGGETVRDVRAALTAIEASYAHGVTDEFLLPIVLEGRPRIDPARDSAVFVNFRPDRGRQLTRRLIERGVRLTTMTRYAEDIECPVVFAEQHVAATLAETLSHAGLRQLHVAETEKYAHVTYFFNGGVESAWDGETRLLVPSPRDVPSYDKAPAMSAPEVAERFAAEIVNGYAFAVVNFANPDMVGHTGVIPAVIDAVEVVDAALGTVVEATHDVGGVCLVTADHGNAEKMLEDDGVSPHTAHTTNPVPLVVTAAGAALRDAGELADLAPTVLTLLGVPIPAEMTGRPLVVTDNL